VLLKSQEALLEFRQQREIVRCEDLALNNGEIDLDLVQPAGMHRGVEWDQGRPLVLKAPDGLRAAMRGAIVHDPEDTVSRTVGFSTHHLGHQPIKGSDAVYGFATAEEFGVVNVPSSDIRSERHGGCTRARHTTRDRGQAIKPCLRRARGSQLAGRKAVTGIANWLPITELGQGAPFKIQSSVVATHSDLKGGIAWEMGLQV